MQQNETPTALPQRRKWQYVAVAMGIVAVLASLFSLGGGQYATPQGQMFATVCMLVPLFATMVVQRYHHEPLLEHLGISWRINRWWFVGWLLMPLLSIAFVAASTLVPGASFSTQTETIRTVLQPAESQGISMSPWVLVASQLLGGIFAGVTLNALFAFGEEVGWRGFLLRFYEGQTMLRTSLETGLIWGLWHAPIILLGHNYPEHPVAGIAMMVAFCIAFTPIITYIRIKARSVIAAAIVHGTFNGVAGLSMLLIDGSNDLLTGATGLAGIAVMLVIDAVILHLMPTVSLE